jgi:hypothetical protein
MSPPLNTVEVHTVSWYRKFKEKPLTRHRHRWQDNTKIDIKLGRGFSLHMITTDEGIL